MNDASRQRADQFRPLVAFDFDGTLTWRDSFRAFLAWKSGGGRYSLGLAQLAPDALGWLHHRDRGRLKAAMVRRFMGGARLEDVEADARAFATDQARALLRPDAMRLWRQWQARNARLIIVTASPEIVVAPFAHGLGADMLIGTRLVVDTKDRLTGDLSGPNCRGPEKVARLRDVFGADVRLEAAYGDSAGDLEMLALAEEAGMKVFGARP